MADVHSYENDEVEVTWSKSTCIHAAVCVKGMPGVFDLAKKPWINVDGGDAKALEEHILRCPSGALQFRKK